MLIAVLVNKYLVVPCFAVTSDAAASRIGTLDIFRIDPMFAIAIEHVWKDRCLKQHKDCRMLRRMTYLVCGQGL